MSSIIDKIRLKTLCKLFIKNRQTKRRISPKSADLFDNIQFSRVRILPVGEKREKASTVFTLKFSALRYEKTAYLRVFLCASISLHQYVLRL